MDKAYSEKVAEWLLIAKGDLISARTLSKHEPVVGFSACFHAQQCVEKALKGYLTYCDQRFERTHDLVRLMDLCVKFDIEFSNYRESADLLTPYGVETRYPNDYREISLKETKDAVTKAEQIYNFVKSKLDPVVLV